MFTILRNYKEGWNSGLQRYLNPWLVPTLLWSHTLGARFLLKLPYNGHSPTLASKFCLGVAVVERFMYIWDKIPNGQDWTAQILFYQLFSNQCCVIFIAEFHTDEIHIDEEEPTVLPPLLQEAEDADKLLRKPTKFEMMRRFRSRKTKRKSQIPIHPSHLTEVRSVWST